MLAVWIFVVVSFIATGAMDENDSDERSKRNTTQFASMIKFKTGRPALDYKNYGCWCGIGGRGKTVDGVDSCCKTHDLCYGRIKTSRCSPESKEYRYSDRKGKKKGRIYCSRYKSSRCAYSTCNCDKSAAYCFSGKPYNQNYQGYNKSRC